MVVNEDQHIESHFDNAAEQYDQVFTLSSIGLMQRARVYHWLEQSGILKSSKKILEINCGTGYDAEQLKNLGHQVYATDASAKMIEVARSSRSNSIQFAQMDFDQVASSDQIQKSDVLFSNFGGLNCISGDHLKKFLSSVSEKQKSGDCVALVLIPKICMWESKYFFFRLEWSKVFRRYTKKPLNVNVDGTLVPTWYHSPKEVTRVLSENYIIRLVKPVAVWLPPSYLEPLFKKWPKSLKFLNKLEQVFGRFSILSSVSDHFIIIAEKS